MNIISSFLSISSSFLVKRRSPIKGMVPKNGTLCSLNVVSLVIRPPSMIVSPSLTMTSVSASLVSNIGATIPLDASSV